jgi:hypothetical protein
MKKVVYSDGSTRVTIATNDNWDEATPFWVYYNEKLVSKFSTKETAKAYAKVILNG